MQGNEYKRQEWEQLAEKSEAPRALSCVWGCGCCVTPRVLSPENILNSSIAEINQSADNLHVFLLICGLRQVKDPLYVVDVFSGMFLRSPSVYGRGTSSHFSL